jgi:hypothetical protein
MPCAPCHVRGRSGRPAAAASRSAAVVLLVLFDRDDGPDPTAAQLARRLGVSRETVRRLAIAGAPPHTVFCRGNRKTARRFAASGLGTAGLAAFAARDIRQASPAYEA